MTKKVSQKALKFQLDVWASKEKQKFVKGKDKAIVKMKKFELINLERDLKLFSSSPYQKWKLGGFYQYDLASKRKKIRELKKEI